VAPAGIVDRFLRLLRPAIHARGAAADMIWGDGARLHWAVRTTDLSARDFSRGYFECQGH
jgi:hypothetical protein